MSWGGETGPLCALPLELGHIVHVGGSERRNQRNAAGVGDEVVWGLSHAIGWVRSSCFSAQRKGTRAADDGQPLVEAAPPPQFGEERLVVGVAYTRAVRCLETRSCAAHLRPSNPSFNELTTAV